MILHKTRFLQLSSFRISAACLLAALVGATGQPARAADTTRVCNPSAYGAKADGTTKDTAAIQKAIDVCSTVGGGIVRLSGGTFLTGPIILKSHITLDVEKGATLLGSADPGDYPESHIVNGSTPHPLIYSLNAEDITITGGGVIDGNGASFWKRAKGGDSTGQSKHGGHKQKIAGAHTRPRLIVFDHDNHVVMDDITVQNGAEWQITPYFTSNIDIHDIRVLAPGNSPNTDGIDPFSCHNVTISHVYISVGDDDVAVKSGLPHAHGLLEPSTNVTVTDSIFGTGHGMSIGSEGAGGMQGVHVARLLFKGTTNGIRIKSARDRGNKNMGDFDFTDIKMQDVEYPILVDQYYHAPSEIRFPQDDSTKRPIAPLTPFYHDISITNLTATGAKIAGIIAELPESPLTSITLTNVNVTAETGMLIMNATVKASHLVIRVNRGAPVTLLTGGKLIGK